MRVSSAKFEVVKYRRFFEIVNFKLCLLHN